MYCQLQILKSNTNNNVLFGPTKSVEMEYFSIESGLGAPERVSGSGAPASAPGAGHRGGWGMVWRAHGAAVGGPARPPVARERRSARGRNTGGRCGIAAPGRRAAAAGIPTREVAPSGRPPPPDAQTRPGDHRRGSARPLPDGSALGRRPREGEGRRPARSGAAQPAPRGGAGTTHSPRNRRHAAEADGGKWRRRRDSNPRDPFGGLLI